MGLIRMISERRRQLIERHADEYLEPGETVLHWVRTRQVGSRTEGFAYLTSERCVIFWSGKSDGHAAVRWNEMETWGVFVRGDCVPILGIGTSEGAWFAELCVRTKNMGKEVRSFIERFYDHAPRTRRELHEGSHLGRFEAKRDVEVERKRATVNDITKRVAITVVGAALILGSPVIALLPGPWSILLAIGGLAVLAREYDWAKDALEWARDLYAQARTKLAKKTAG